MNGMEMLEKMEMIASEYVQEADKPLQKGKKPLGKVIIFYVAGMAAGFVMMILSAAMLFLNGNMLTMETGTPNGWAATAFGGNASLALILLVLSAAVIALFAFLIIRRNKRD